MLAAVMFPRTRQSLRLRRWISAGLLMAMLFMQFAAAAYACPRVAPAMADCPG